MMSTITKKNNKMIILIAQEKILDWGGERREAGSEIEQLGFTATTKKCHALQKMVTELLTYRNRATQDEIFSIRSQEFVKS